MSACKAIHVELELIASTSSDLTTVSVQLEQLVIHSMHVNLQEFPIVKDRDVPSLKLAREASFVTEVHVPRRTLVLMIHSVHLKMRVSWLIVKLVVSALTLVTQPSAGQMLIVP